MTREEAIEQLKNITSVPSMFIDETIKELVEALQEPPTLAEFLGWEEGIEYEYCTGDVLRIDNKRLYYKSDACSSGWCNYGFYGNEIEELRQAKKAKKTKDELLDELQEIVSSEKINEIIKQLREVE